MVIRFIIMVVPGTILGILGSSGWDEPWVVCQGMTTPQHFIDIIPPTSMFLGGEKNLESPEENYTHSKTSSESNQGFRSSKAQECYLLIFLTKNVN